MSSSENTEIIHSDKVTYGIPDPRPRFKMILAYDGSSFHGWQKQLPPDGEPLRTVAGEVENALQVLLGEPINLVGASRTDSGVHAKGQTAHFNAAPRMPVSRMLRAINDRIPDDVEVLSIEEVNQSFDAIGDVTHKQYRYRYYNSPHKPLFRRNDVSHTGIALDVSRMNDAAQRLIGTHDVAGFAAADHGRQTTIRTILNCHVEHHALKDIEPEWMRRQYQPLDEKAPEWMRYEPSEIHIVVSGTGFLYHMVRIIAGTLREVGRGHFEPQRIDEILDKADRSLAGPTAGPEGLCLEWIKYNELIQHTKQ